MHDEVADAQTVDGRAVERVDRASSRAAPRGVPSPSGRSAPPRTPAAPARAAASAGRAAAPAPRSRRSTGRGPRRRCSSRLAAASSADQRLDRARPRRRRAHRARTRPSSSRASGVTPTVPLLLVPRRRQSVPAPTASATSPCLPGSELDGDLAVGLSPEVRELNRLTLLRRQLVERGAHPLGGDDRHRHLLHVGRDRRLVPDLLVAAAPRFLAPDVVDRPPVRERPEPGAQPAAVRIERVGPLPQVQEHVLGHVLGGPPVADHPPGEPEDERRVLVVALAQARLVARSRRRRWTSCSQSVRGGHGSVQPRAGSTTDRVRRGPAGSDHRRSGGDQCIRLRSRAAVWQTASTLLPSGSRTKPP